MPADRKAINKNYYEANKDARLLGNTIVRILHGRRPWAKTLKRFELGEREYKSTPTADILASLFSPFHFNIRFYI